MGWRVSSNRSWAEPGLEPASGHGGNGGRTSPAQGAESTSRHRFAQPLCYGGDVRPRGRARPRGRTSPAGRRRRWSPSRGRRGSRYRPWSGRGTAAVGDKRRVQLEGSVGTRCGSAPKGVVVVRDGTAAEAPPHGRGARHHCGPGTSRRHPPLRRAAGDGRTPASPAHRRGRPRGSVRRGEGLLSRCDGRGAGSSAARPDASDPRYGARPRCGASGRCEAGPWCDAGPRCGAVLRCGAGPRCGASRRCGPEPRCGARPWCEAGPRRGAVPRCGADPQCGAEPRCGTEPRCGASRRCEAEPRCGADPRCGPGPRCEAGRRGGADLSCEAGGR